MVLLSMDGSLKATLPRSGFVQQLNKPLSIVKGFYLCFLSPYQAKDYNTLDAQERKIGLFI